MSPMRLYILHKLPTPYNDDLFKALHADPEIQLQVFHLWRGSGRRPWKSELGTGYPNYYLRPVLGVDWRALRLAWTDTDSLFMVGDWAHFPSVALLLARITRGSPAALWVDTPQEQIRRPFPKRILRAAFLRWLLPNVDIIFGSGRPARRALIEMGAPPHKIVDLQFVVDLGRPADATARAEVVEYAKELRRSVGCETDGIVFGMSGTIDLAKKAQDMGVRALAECCQTTTAQIGLLVAGTGPELSSLQALVDDLGVADRVNLIGWQEPDQMDGFYAAIDVLLHPATYDPFPLVVVEAMSWSKPIIGTITSGSVEEKIEDGINGFVIPPKDVKAIATAMMHFLEDPGVLRTAGGAARRAAEAWPMSRATKTVKDQLCAFQRQVQSGIDP